MVCNSDTHCSVISVVTLFPLGKVSPTTSMEVSYKDSAINAQT